MAKASPPPVRDEVNTPPTRLFSRRSCGSYTRTRCPYHCSISTIFSFRLSRYDVQPSIIHWCFAPAVDTDSLALATFVVSLALCVRGGLQVTNIETFRRDANTYDSRFHLTPIAQGKALPRAWERKPATPFAPRTESHKIWKRYGLRSQNSHEGSDSFLFDTGRVGIGKENLHTVRAIKSLRNDFDGATATKWEGEPEARRRRSTST